MARLQGPPSARSGVATDGSEYRIMAVPLTGLGDYALVVGRPLQVINDTLTSLWLVLILFGATGVVLAAIAGNAVARSSLRPVRELAAAVEHVTLTEDLNPIAVSGSDDVTRLAEAFNRMLRSLASSRERQQRLIADAGHELRTPLTSLRTNIELLAADERTRMLSSDDRAAILADVTAQLAEFTTLDRRPGPPHARRPGRRRAGADRPARRGERRAGAGTPASQGFDLRRRAEPAVRGRRGRRPGTGRHQPVGQRREVEPTRWHRPRAPRGRPAPGRRPGTRASPRPTCRTCSTGSTAARPPGPHPAPGSDCPSPPRPSRGTAAGSAPVVRLRAAPSSPSGCRAPPPWRTSNPTVRRRTRLLSPSTSSGRALSKGPGA